MITSTQNTLVKQIRRLLRSKRSREQEGLFVVEGIQGVVEAVQSRAPLHALVYAPDLLTSEVGYAAIERAAARGVRCEQIAATLFDTISERDNPVGLLAVVERRLLPLDALAISPEGLYVALTDVSDPGNLGTVLRTVDAVGADALLLVGETVDPYHPSTVKASAGTIFSVPIAPVADLDSLLRWAQQHALPVIATSDKGEQLYWTLPYPSPLLLLMGSEAHGLAPELLDSLPQVVRIPMHGSADSLNLGVATALLLYEVRRQRWQAAHP